MSRAALLLLTALPYGCSYSADYSLTVDVPGASAGQALSIVRAQAKAALQDDGTGLCVIMTAEHGTVACPGGICELDGGMEAPSSEAAEAMTLVAPRQADFIYRAAANSMTDVITGRLYKSSACPPSAGASVEAIADATIGVTATTADLAPPSPPADMQQTD